MLHLLDCDLGAGRPRVMCAHRWQRHGLFLTKESGLAGKCSTRHPRLAKQEQKGYDKGRGSTASH